MNNHPHTDNSYYATVSHNLDVFEGFWPVEHVSDVGSCQKVNMLPSKSWKMLKCITFVCFTRFLNIFDRFEEILFVFWRYELPVFTKFSVTNHYLKCKLKICCWRTQTTVKTERLNLFEAIKCYLVNYDFHQSHVKTQLTKTIMAITFQLGPYIRLR